MIIRNLKQEYYDSREQILFYEEMNEFSGQWLPVFETRHYEKGTTYEAVHRFWGLDNDQDMLRAIYLTSVREYKGGDFNKAMSAIETADEDHWTKKLPTEPGWYKVIIYKEIKEVMFGRVHVNRAGDFKWSCVGWAADEPLGNQGRPEWWWSVPEIVPPLPEEGK